MIETICVVIAVLFILVMVLMGCSRDDHLIDPRSLDYERDTEQEETEGT